MIVSSRVFQRHLYASRALNLAFIKEMNLNFGIFMKSCILRVSCNLGFTLPLQETRSIHDSMNRPKWNILLIFTFYYKYLKYKQILII